MSKGRKGGNPDIKKHGFGENPDNINRSGRPKKLLTILKEKGFGKDDIKTAMGELAWYTIEEARELMDDGSKPLIMKIVAGQFIEAFDKKDWNKIKEILEHTIGKPRQEIGIEADAEILPTNFIVNGKKREDS